MMKNIVLVLFIAAIAVVGFGETGATQVISGINASSISHKDSVTLTGSGFGIKNPAAPLMWDDCESQSNEDLPITEANSLSLVGYSHYEPGDTNNGHDVPTSHEIRYRSIPHSPVSTPVNGPHDQSTMYLTGGHYDDGVTHCMGVSATIPTETGYKDRWYVRFYYRLSPEWPSCAGDSNNHKFTVFQEGTSPFSVSSPPYNEYFYFNYNGNACPCSHGNVTYRAQGIAPLIQSREYNLPNDGLDGLWDSSYQNTPGMMNPYTNWITLEQIVSNDQGSMYLYQDNTLVWQGAGEPDFFTGNTGNDWGFRGIQSFTIGGYYRYTGIGGNQAHSDAFRFFDDIYVDDTLSRIMLANNQNYSEATIIEPQIPSDWSDSSITVTTNLGKLNGSKAYLFVFDENNTHNDVGFEVSLGEESDAPPTRSNPSPTGTLFAGTIQTNISLTTNINATCRYYNSPGTNYTDMPFNFTNTNSTNHSTPVTGLENGQVYIYYIRCNGSNGYVNEDDFNITFSVDGHKADLNDDGIINMPELMLFIARWKINDGVTKAEVEEARDIWFAGGVY